MVDVYVFLIFSPFGMFLLSLLMFKLFICFSMLFSFWDVSFGVRFVVDLMVGCFFGAILLALSLSGVMEI